jgi:hypothetical protein
MLTIKAANKVRFIAFVLVCLTAILSLSSCQGKKKRIASYHQNIMDSVKHKAEFNITYITTVIGSEELKVLKIKTAKDLIFLDSVRYWSGSGNITSRTTIDNLRNKGVTRTVSMN